MYKETKQMQHKLTLSIITALLLTFSGCATKDAPRNNDILDINNETLKVLDYVNGGATVYSKSVFEAAKIISVKSSKPIVLQGNDIEIEDNVRFLNYQDISDYILAKELPYKLDIQSFPSFDKLTVKPLDAIAKKLKNTAVVVGGVSNSYLEVQTIAQSLAVALSADTYSISQLSKDNAVAFNGNAYDFMQMLADQNNLFFEIEDEKIIFRQFGENIFSITVAPFAIKGDSSQNIQRGGTTTASRSGSNMSSSSLSSSSSGSSTGSSLSSSSNSTLTKQSISFEIYKELDQTIKNIIGENAGAYHLNQASGQLFVRTKKDNMKTIKKIIDNFNEIYSKIVEINMTIVEVNLSEKFEAGIDLGVLANNITADLKGSTIAATGSSLTISGSAFTNGNFKFTSAIKALQQFGNTKITSKTVSTTINNIPVYGMSNLERDYISELSQTQSGTVSTLNTVSTNKATATDGLSFYLFPKINTSTGKIMLTIQPKLSKFLGLEPFSPAPGSYVQNETRNQKEFTSTVILDDGGTAIIAGISNDSNTNDKQGLPFLTSEENSFGDFLGGKRSGNKSRSEIVIFVTAKVSK